jgi:hypothetical protein
MSRQKSPLVAQRNDSLLRRIQALKAEHPFWGYRRITESGSVFKQSSSDMQVEELAEAP